MIITATNNNNNINKIYGAKVSEKSFFFSSDLCYAKKKNCRLCSIINRIIYLLLVYIPNIAYIVGNFIISFTIHMQRHYGPVGKKHS